MNIIKSFPFNGKGFVIFVVMKSFQDKDLQSFIGNLLRYGVIIAMVIVIIGLAAYLFQSSHKAIDYSVFDKNNGFVFSSFRERLMHGESAAIMELGVIALI